MRTYRYLEVVMAYSGWGTSIWMMFQSSPKFMPMRTFKIGRIVWATEEE